MTTKLNVKYRSDIGIVEHFNFAQVVSTCYSPYSPDFKDSAITLRMSNGDEFTLSGIKARAVYLGLTGEVAPIGPSPVGTE